METRGWWVVGVALSVLGCGAELAETIPNVRVDKIVPDDLSCRELGTVYGSGGGGDLSSNEQKLASAQEDLRQRAAWMGANFVVLDLSTRDRDTLTLSGRALSCQDRPKQPNVLEAKPAPNVAKPADPAQNPEQRLRTLDELHQKGLVTETEYQERRKAIVDSL